MIAIYLLFFSSWYTSDWSSLSGLIDGDGNPRILRGGEIWWGDLRLSSPLLIFRGDCLNIFHVVASAPWGDRSLSECLDGKLKGAAGSWGKSRRHPTFAARGGGKEPSSSLNSFPRDRRRHHLLLRLLTSQCTIKQEYEKLPSTEQVRNVLATVKTRSGQSHSWVNASSH